jgi:hypothetical protein
MDVYLKYLDELKVEQDDYNRYQDIYKMSSFSSQGVELHKTVMAYHFAFNDVIKNTKGLHRFPFVLDAIFKEDIEDNNKSMILEFIKRNAPSDTQTLISIAVSKENEKIVSGYSKLLGENIKIIYIGNLVESRSLLTMESSKYSEMIEETFGYIVS